MVHPLLGYIHKDFVAFLFYYGFFQNYSVACLTILIYLGQYIQ
jgi:hypothetical protein